MLEVRVRARLDLVELRRRVIEVADAVDDRARAFEARRVVARQVEGDARRASRDELIFAHMRAFAELRGEGCHSSRSLSRNRAERSCLAATRALRSACRNSFRAANLS